MKRVLILGGAGMLGHKAFQVLSEDFDVGVTFRRFDDRLRATALFPEQRVINEVDATDLSSIKRALSRFSPDCVLNCIGIIKQLKEAKDARASIYTNALFPHLLAELCQDIGARLIHVSTDCVFSGRKGSYRESDAADADDLYGRTKYLGEVAYPGTLTIRTSIIGRELFSNVSLVDWFLSQRGNKIRGFRRAIFTGFTTLALAREISRIIRVQPKLSGLYQVSADPINKYELLLLLRQAYGIDVEIEPYDDFLCDRSLCSDRYRSETGFRPMEWPAMVHEMAQDPTPYDALRNATVAALT